MDLCSAQAALAGQETLLAHLADRRAFRPSPLRYHRSFQLCTTGGEEMPKLLPLHGDFRKQLSPAANQRVEGPAESKAVGHRFMQAPSPPPRQRAQGQKPLQRTGVHADTCPAEHARVTCHRAVRTSRHEHNAHAPGWHAATECEALPLHSRRRTDKGAQDHLHSKTEPPSRSPCTNIDGCMQSKRRHASFACPAAEMAQLDWPGSVQTQLMLKTQRKRSAELPHGSKMCHLPSHQTKGQP